MIQSSYTNDMKKCVSYKICSNTENGLGQYTFGRVTKSFRMGLIAHNYPASLKGCKAFYLYSFVKSLNLIGCTYNFNSYKA